MKSILISIKPEYVEKILNGEKTIEIRKTKPNIELPCKVYICCTKKKIRANKYLYINEPKIRAKFGITDYWCDYKTDKIIINEGMPAHEYTTYITKGKAVAEFTLNKIDTIEVCDPDVLVNGKIVNVMEYTKDICIRHDDFFDYIGYGNDHDGWGNKEWSVGYAWHIEGLKIYDKPKELSEFSSILKRMKGEESRFTSHLLQRPPQSWCYVKGLEE